MKYQCVQCDEAFEHDGEGRARCPKCMRVHGIVEAGATPAAVTVSSSKWWGLALGVTLLAAALFFAVRDRQQVKPGVVESTPLSATTLERQLEAMGISLGDLAGVLDVGDAVETFAQRVTADASTPDAQLNAVVDAVRKRAQKRAFVPWSLVDPRDTLPMKPVDTLVALDKDGAAQHLYPLEVALLTTVALRALDATAMVAELHQFEGERAPLDPSGRLGYFGVALVDGEGKATHVIDVYGGRTMQPKPADVTILNDLQTVGAMLNLRALYRALRQQRPTEAMADAKAALKLAPRSSGVRGGYAAVALANGGVGEGEAELQAAAQLRRGSAQRNNLAVLYLAKGDSDSATKEIAQALADHRDFAGGHATLASIHLAMGQREDALRALQEAERLDAELPNLALLWSHYYATEGDLPRALQKAEQGVARRPNDAQSHLMLARIYRESGRLDEMRRSAQRVLELSPSTQRTEMESLIRQLLGPTALDKTADEILEGTPGGALPTTGGTLDLARGSKLLGAEGGNDAPAAAEPTGDAPLLRLGDSSKLKLSAPGEQLQLRGSPAQ